MVAVLIIDCATVASVPDTLHDIAPTPDRMQLLYLLLHLLLKQRLSEWIWMPTVQTRLFVTVVATQVTLLHSARRSSPR